MPSPKDYALAFLVLTSATAGALAWKQHLELAELRAAALRPQERADWQQRVWAAEKQRTELEGRVAALTAKSETAAPAESVAPAGADLPRPPRSGANFAALAEDPEIQRLMALQQRSGLDGRYADLFKSLHLTPQQLEQFKNLLVEKSTAMMDVLAAARSQGVNPRTNRDAFRQLVTDAQTEIDANIRSTIGEAAFSDYQRYEQTLPQRSVVNQLEQRLSYSPTPLTPQQSDQLVQLLAAAAPATSGATSTRGGFAGGLANAFGRGPSPAITDTAITQAAGTLAGPQLDALRQLQQEQQAQAALAAAYRAQAEAARRSPPAGAGGSPTPRPATPGG